MSSGKISLPYEEIEGRRRNSRTFVANGFGYLIKTNKGTVAYMGCVRGKYCPATALLVESQKVLIPKRDHNHPPTPQEFVKIKFMASLKRKVEHSDLKLCEFFKRELEKANVKNPHDLGIDFKKFESTLYGRRVRTNKKQVQIGDNASSSYPGHGITHETPGTLPSISYEEDADDVSMEPVCEVHPMEVGGEGSNEDDRCSLEIHAPVDSADIEVSDQEVIDLTTQAGAAAKDSCSLPVEQPTFATTSRVSPGPQQTLHAEQASTSHAYENLPAIDPSGCSLSSERYQLHHKNHLSLVLNQLAEDEAFMDVTLTAEGRQVKAHKNVLAAASPYFSTVLRGNPCQHPIIIMPNDVHHAQLLQIISFIYRGEVSVTTTELLPLMKVADQLLITGLSQKGSMNPLGDFHPRETEDSARSFPLHPLSLPRGTPRTDFNAVGTTGGIDSAKQIKSKKLADASDRIRSHSKDDQATSPVIGACDPSPVESAQDSDEDDSDGFDADFLDPTPVGSPSNDTPVIDVDLSFIKEEHFTVESTAKLPNAIQEDPLHHSYPSSSDQLDSEREDAYSSKASSSRTPKTTRCSTTTNNSALTSSPYNLNPVVRLEKVGPSSSGIGMKSWLEQAGPSATSTGMNCRLEQAGPSAKASSMDSKLEKAGSSAKGGKLGYTNLCSVEHDPYVCPYCRRSFSDLTDHFTNNHITQPAFICSRCCRVYTDKAVFIAHRTKCD